MRKKRKNVKFMLLNLSLLFSLITPSTLAQAPISNARSGLVHNQVTQLERIINAHSQLLIQLQQQIADNQHDIDSLRGQIQENQYQLLKLSNMQEKMDKKMENFFRMPVSYSENDSHCLVAPTIDPAFSNKEEADIAYNKALSLMIKKKQYDQSIIAFKDFIKQNPHSHYQPNANYWLGQLNYKKGEKDEAAYYFAMVVKKYPKSTKSPDALLKIGIIMKEKGQQDQAKVILKQVGKLYPSADAAKQAQKYLSKL